MKYILASASPRRKELLTQAGISFTNFPSSIEERITKTDPCDVVMELAFQKAREVYLRFCTSRKEVAASEEDFIVIGAYTIVVYRGEILGKPSDKSEAYDMLSLLADRTHQVYTGVSLIMCKNGKESHRTFYEKTDVTLYKITREDLHAYVESGDSLDKAGAYGIQGPFAIHVKRINGDYNNVVGLPIGRLYHELSTFIPS